ncbi:hypothetical protein LX81_04230 [Palleronia aestuarii]|uniref:Transposase n=1 Tax=Palleronia aestuarii TaxID=568105 RepID=A0A2W7PM03_9RHOB|nr:hypothetical protein LX81_04230 [Palleronia aestuarii]
MPAAYVKPYVKRGKTDAADAEAICKAVTRPTMRFVPVKSAECQTALKRNPLSAAKKGSESNLVHLQRHDAVTRRALRSSMLALPYIWRLRVFRRLGPSLGLAFEPRLCQRCDHGSLISDESAGE